MFQLTFDVSRVCILQMEHGPDRVSIHTTQPSPTPGVTADPLALDFAVEWEKGPEYVAGLGIPAELVEVIRLRS